MVNRVIHLIEAVEMLPQSCSVIPISGLLGNCRRVLKSGKSVEPSVAALALHCHSKSRNDRRENVLVCVQNKLDVELICGVIIEKIIGEIFSACFINRESRESAVSRLCTISALDIVDGKHL